MNTYFLTNREQQQIITVMKFRVLQLERRMELLIGDLSLQTTLTENLVYRDTLIDIHKEIKTCMDIIHKTESPKMGEAI
jgi:hypothetical protein